MEINLSTFAKERNAAFFSLDEGKIKAWARKWKIQLPTTTDGFWGGVYKACLAINSCPEDVKTIAKAWLSGHNMSEKIGRYGRG